MKTIFLLLASFLFTGCTQRMQGAKEMEDFFNVRFGFYPDSSVGSYKYNSDTVGDSLSIWFAFQCSETTFDKIHATGFQFIRSIDPMSPSPVWRRDIELGDLNAPNWWQKVPGPVSIFWKEWRSVDGAGHYLYLWRETSSKTVYSKSADWQ